MSKQNMSKQIKGNENIAKQSMTSEVAEGLERCVLGKRWRHFPSRSCPFPVQQPFASLVSEARRQCRHPLPGPEHRSHCIDWVKQSKLHFLFPVVAWSGPAMGGWWGRRIRKDMPTVCFVKPITQISGDIVFRLKTSPLLAVWAFLSSRFRIPDGNQGMKTFWHLIVGCSSCHEIEALPPTAGPLTNCLRLHEAGGLVFTPRPYQVAAWNRK